MRKTGKGDENARQLSEEERQQLAELLMKAARNIEVSPALVITPPPPGHEERTTEGLENAMRHLMPAMNGLFEGCASIGWHPHEIMVTFITYVFTKTAAEVTGKLREHLQSYCDHSAALMEELAPYDGPAPHQEEDKDA